MDGCMLTTKSPGWGSLYTRTLALKCPEIYAIRVDPYVQLSLMWTDSVDALLHGVSEMYTWLIVLWLQLLEDDENEDGRSWLSVDEDGRSFSRPYGLVKGQTFIKCLQGLQIISSLMKLFFILFAKYSRPYVCLFKALHLFFLPNFPGAMCFPCPTSTVNC